MPSPVDTINGNLDVLGPYVAPVLKQKARRAVVRTTLTGKVVYKRKRHFFTYKDVLRIIRHLTVFEGTRPATPEEFIKDVSRIELGILGILNRYYGNRLGTAFIEFLTRLFDNLAEPGFDWLTFIKEELKNGEGSS